MKIEIIKSSIKTPDGTILTSYHRHDFKMYEDKITGKQYGIDGGNDYQRYLGDINDCEIILITNEDDFNLIRENFTWGSYGIDGNQEKVYKKLSELSNNHIQAIIKTQNHLNNKTKNFFKQELEYRKEKKIFIVDK